MRHLLGLDAGVVLAHDLPLLGLEQVPAPRLVFGPQQPGLLHDPRKAIAVALGVVLGVLRHGLRPQHPVSPLTRLPGHPSGVRYRSKLSTSRLQPSEHVGKHSSGAGGCWAGLGKGGAFGGGTTGGKLGGTVAQAVTSNGTSSSSQRPAAGVLFGFMGDLLMLADPGGLDGAIVGLGLPGGLGRMGALGLHLGLQLGDSQLGVVQAPRLHAGQQTHRQHGAQHDAGHVRPSHMARSFSRRLGRPPQRFAGSRQSRPWKNTQRSN